MLRSGRYSIVSRVLPRLFCRVISVSSGAERTSFTATGPTYSSSSSSLLIPSDISSSASDFCLESEEEDELEGIPKIHQIQTLRAYLRNRRARCLNRVREQGLVPAVIVHHDKEQRPTDGSADTIISVDSGPLVSILKFIGKRDFLSRVFDMEIFKSPSSSDLHEKLQVLPRNLNYGAGKTNILSIQFMRAPAGQVMKLGVPLEFLGIDQCPGLKKGGTLKQLAKYIVYNCKATEMPAKIVVDMTVLEIGDRVLVQDLEVDFDLLYSDRMMAVCEIVKDVRSLKARARKLKNEIHYKRRALDERGKETQSQLLTDDEVEYSEESSMDTRSKRTKKTLDEGKSRASSMSDDEVEVNDDGEDEVIPYRYKKSRALALGGAEAAKYIIKRDSKSTASETKRNLKSSKRGLKDAAFVKADVVDEAGKREASDSGEDEVIPPRYRKSPTLASRVTEVPDSSSRKSGAGGRTNLRTKNVDESSKKDTKSLKRRLTGAAFLKPKLAGRSGEKETSTTKSTRK
ncbi:hypothetical protein KP509_16G078400 [Ceratopteris richardii]|uniref:Large ribosomal subunit protein bL25 beta domain-containing protein n=1 Tax=Ceratopteris richardii TaxID=49495 RepID=A0A8T2T4R7_CERRI|nr:hypothetical protein KP509_16G078400 [Ceratopteris richardii]